MSLGWRLLSVIVALSSIRDLWHQLNIFVLRVHLFFILLCHLQKVNVPIMLVLEGKVTIVVLVYCPLQINCISVVDNKTVVVFKAPFSYFKASCCLVKVGLAFTKLTCVYIIFWTVYTWTSTPTTLARLRFTNFLACGHDPEWSIRSLLVHIVFC